MYLKRDKFGAERGVGGVFYLGVEINSFWWGEVATWLVFSMAATLGVNVDCGGVGLYWHLGKEEIACAA